ncbi:MAG: septum formation family protein, partial [Acidimicrobiia bacterium]|nr:septum formation family protein [Acidimicrobiia bacterium]
MPTPDYLPPTPTSGSRISLLRRLPIGWLIVGLVFAGGSIFRSITSADRDETGTVVGAGDVPSDALEVGDCLLFPSDVAEDGSFEFDSLRAVPCSEPHDMEVFGQVLHPDGLHPGNDALSDFAAEKCEPLFESYVGLAVDQEARLVYSVSYPQIQSWKAGDRGVDCLLESWDGTQLTGSQKGQGLLGFGGLVVGSCYDYTEAETYVYFTDVECADPHALQIYATEVL